MSRLPLTPAEEEEEERRLRTQLLVTIGGNLVLRATAGTPHEGTAGYIVGLLREDTARTALILNELGSLVSSATTAVCTGAGKVRNAASTVASTVGSGVSAVGGLARGAMTGTASAVGSGASAVGGLASSAYGTACSAIASLSSGFSDLVFRRAAVNSPELMAATATAVAAGVAEARRTNGNATPPPAATAAAVVAAVTASPAVAAAAQATGEQVASAVIDTSPQLTVSQRLALISGKGPKSGSNSAKKPRSHRSNRRRSTYRK